MDNKIWQSLSTQSIKNIYRSYIDDISFHQNKLTDWRGIGDQERLWHESELKRIQNDLEIFSRANWIELEWGEKTDITNTVKIKLSSLKWIYVKINNTNNYLNEEEYQEFLSLMNLDSRSWEQVNRYIELSTKNIFGESLNEHKSDLVNSLENKSI